jgi:3-hydroxybutyryl-CoA dehydrogenase
VSVNRVAVIGAGTMGSGIAQVCAQAGCEVILNDAEPLTLEKAIETIRWSVGKLAQKGKLSEDPDSIMNRIKIAPGLSSVADTDLVIEAVFENLNVKQELFIEVSSCANPDVMLASNTSAIPITELAAVTRSPQRVVGLHFFNPVPMMKAVEVVRGMQTSPQTLKRAVEFVKKLGMQPVRVARDVPGFLLNRINLVGYVEAIRLVESGVGNVEDIDRGVRLAFGRKMGPFETGDIVGLDISCGALAAIYEDSRDDRFFPPQLLRRKVKAGHLGRKTGTGWYCWREDGTRGDPAGDGDSTEE